jgi:hypothetical protein
VADLVQSVVNVLGQSGDTLDGVLILIDEADRPPEAAGLGLFLKLFTERLTRKECCKCLIGLAGLPSLVGRLRASHESSPRVFEAMTLEPLGDGERRDVVERGIKLANDKNEVLTSITPEATQLIA